MRITSIFAPLFTALLFASNTAAQENGHQHDAVDASPAESQPQHIGHHPAQDEHAGHSAGGTEHTHHHGAGMWMFEYRYSRMIMGESLRGTEFVDSGMTMNMDMHMFHAMYSVTDKLTFMTMFHYMYNTMDMMGMDMSMDMSTAGTASSGGGHGGHGKVAARHGAATQTAATQTTASATAVSGAEGTMDHLVSYGIGDTLVSALYKIADPVTVTLGVSLPTGPVDIMMNDSMGTPYYLPYSMQLGSGTYDLIPAIAYSDNIDQIGFGAELAYTYRIGENKRGYTLGNRLETSGWLKYQVTNGVSFSTRLAYRNWDVVHRDANRPESETEGYMDNPLSEGGQRVDAFLGIKGSATNMLGFTVELGAPIYQNLNYDKASATSSQMRTTLLMNAAIEYMF